METVVRFRPQSVRSEARSRAGKGITGCLRAEEAFRGHAPAHFEDIVRIQGGAANSFVLDAPIVRQAERAHGRAETLYDRDIARLSRDNLDFGLSGNIHIKAMRQALDFAAAFLH